MSNIMSTFSLGSVALAFSSIIVAMTEPLFSVDDLYDVHLFPENDQINYKVTKLHEDSQNLHIAASVFLGISFLLMLSSTAVGFLKRKTSSSKSSKIASSVVLVIGTIMYIAAAVTLSQVGRRIKRNLEKLPIPVPSVDIVPGWGGEMELVGLFSAVVGTLTGLVAAIKEPSEGYLSLD